LKDTTVLGARVAAYRYLLRQNIDRDKSLCKAEGWNADILLGFYEVHLIKHSVLQQEWPEEFIRECFRDADKSWRASYKSPPTCAGRPASSADNIELSNVIAVEALEYYGEDRFKHKAIAASTLAEVIGEIVNDPDGYRQTFKGTLGNDRNLVWLSPTEDLKQFLAQAPNDWQAHEARCGLGLVHLDGNRHVIVLSFPASFFKDGLALPNFVDGGEHRVFCVWLEPGANFGYTWDLRTQQKGLRELVAPGRTVDGKTDKFDIVYLGFARWPMPPPLYDLIVGA
jgi:hypothetical protein